MKLVILFDGKAYNDNTAGAPGRIWQCYSIEY